MIPAVDITITDIFEVPRLRTAPRTNPTLKFRRADRCQEIASMENHFPTPQPRIFAQPILDVRRRHLFEPSAKQIRNTEKMTKTPKPKETVKGQILFRLVIPKRDVIPLADDQMQFVVDDEPVSFGQRIVPLRQNVKKPVTFLGRAFVGGVRVVRHLESLPCGGVVAVGLSNSMTGFYDTSDRTFSAQFEQADPTHTPATF